MTLSRILPFAVIVVLSFYGCKKDDLNNSNNQNQNNGNSISNPQEVNGTWTVIGGSDIAGTQTSNIQDVIPGNGGFAVRIFTSNGFQGHVAIMTNNGGSSYTSIHDDVNGNTGGIATDENGNLYQIRTKNFHDAYFMEYGGSG